MKKKLGTPDYCWNCRGYFSKEHIPKLKDKKDVLTYFCFKCREALKDADIYHLLTKYPELVRLIKKKK